MAPVSNKARIWLAPNDSMYGRVWCWWYPPSWHPNYTPGGPMYNTFGWTRSFDKTRRQLIAVLTETTKQGEQHG